MDADNPKPIKDCRIDGGELVASTPDGTQYVIRPGMDTSNAGGTCTCIYTPNDKGEMYRFVETPGCPIHSPAKA